ncbi:exonuclease domain-containing protein [Microbacterium sp. NPDC055683]
MATSWPDPPPLFSVDDAGERPTWFGRPASSRPTRAARPAPAALDLVFEEPPSGGLARLGVFDLETTGVDVEADRIVTAYVGLLAADGSVVRERHWMADPGIDIPEGATAVHGITTARARAEGRPAAEVVAEVVTALREIFAEGAPVVAYNAPFDFSMLKHEAVRHGVEAIASPAPVIDPLVVDKTWDRYRKGKRTLEIVAAHYGVALEGAHDASADAVAAGRLALAIAERYADLMPDDVGELHARQVGWAREQAASLTEYFVRIGRIDASEALDGSWPIR